MNILIVMNDYYNMSNGMCISTQRFVRALRQIGNEVRVCANSSNGTPDYPLNALKVPVFANIIEKEGFTFAKSDHDMLERAIDWADIVHVEDPFFICTQAAIMAGRRKKPVTGTFHMYPENMTYSVHMGKSRFWNTLFMLNFRRLVYNRCDAIMCPTVQVEKRLKRYFFHSKLVTISNGIADDIVKYGRDNQSVRSNMHNDGDDKFHILTVGRLSKEKNQQLLFEALRKCRNIDRIKVTVAGKGPLEKQLKSLAKTLPCEVTFGFYRQKDLIEIMLRSDLYVHSANVEVEGMSCMEAFACGAVPLISNARLSSTQSYALHDENIFKANNARMLARKIDYWIERPKELQQVREEYLCLASGLKVSDSAKKLQTMMEGCIG